MTYMDSYRFWLENDFFDSQTRNELKKLNHDEIEDSFYRDLQFGTGGLRGKMGVGTNRMNKYTVGKVTAGLADYLISSFSKELCFNRGVVVAYDTRNNSADFAQVVADVLSSKDIKVFLFNLPVPTPELSFAVKFLNCIAGVVITASHNPKEYNGYKVYDEFGCQLVPHKAKAVESYINAICDYSSIDYSGNKQLQSRIDITSQFVSAVLRQSVFDDTQAKSLLKLVYTPLHGTGNLPVRKVLKSDGFDNVNVVKEQEMPDGNFPTVVSPNPEERSALDLAISLAKKTDSDIVLGTDPDSDRVGVGVRANDRYELLTGNQIGALLVDYVLKKKDITQIHNPAVVKTVVTNDLGAQIAKKHGLTVFSTLTGFKFIGEKITQFESGDTNKDYSFVLGYEESYGYLVGTHARDKDAVVASLLICEMAAEYKKAGKTLYDRLNDIYCEYGYFRDCLDSFKCEGIGGMKRINAIMHELRTQRNLFEDVKSVIDYNKDVEAEEGFGKLPKSDVLKFIFNDESWMAVRPSGTEPKIKFYYSIIGKNKELAESKLLYLKSTVREHFGF